MNHVILKCVTRTTTWQKWTFSIFHSVYVLDSLAFWCDKRVWMIIISLTHSSLMTQIGRPIFTHKKKFVFTIEKIKTSLESSQAGLLAYCEMFRRIIIFVKKHANLVVIIEILWLAQNLDELLHILHRLLIGFPANLLQVQRYKLGPYRLYMWQELWYPFFQQSRRLQNKCESQVFVSREYLIKKKLSALNLRFTDRNTHCSSCVNIHSWLINILLVNDFFLISI